MPHRTSFFLVLACLSPLAACADDEKPGKAGDKPKAPPAPKKK